MPEVKIKQLQYETEGWKRQLAFMSEENINFKNSISEILRDKFNKGLLVQLEEFQTRFIRTDQLITLLRNDIADMDKLLIREVFEDGKILKEIEEKFQKFQLHLNTAQKNFRVLKSDFKSFISKNT